MVDIMEIDDNEKRDEVPCLLCLHHLILFIRMRKKYYLFQDVRGRLYAN